MTEVAEALRTAAGAAFAGEPIAFAYLFGSHATGTATERSDVDVAVHLQPDATTDQTAALGLRLRLAAVLERHTGLGPIEVVILDGSPLSLTGRVQEEGVLLYSVDEEMRVRGASLTSRRYHDFKIHEQRSARERLARLAEGR